MKHREVSIGKQRIGLNHPPFIVAEMSGNHNQSLSCALKIVEAAAKSGCDAIKLQTYTPDTITIDCRSKKFFINNKGSLWKGFYLYDLYKKAFTPWEWHKDIFDRAKELGLLAFSTPFDESAVDFLESLKVPVYKIASFENTHLPLIKKVASTGKPLIISAGMATWGELKEAVRTARRAGCKHIVVLKCTSAYPALPKDANLKTIPNIAKRLNCMVGISDHTQGIGVSLAGVALGARIIERHLTLRRSEGGVDAAFSLEPDEMALLVKEAKRVFYALGRVHYGLTQEEKKNLHFRQSIFAVRDIVEGEELTCDNIRIIRPALGLAPKYWDEVLGKIACRGIKRGTPITWRHLQ